MKDDHYRQHAAEAQSWADKAKSDEDRAAWLRIAEGWLRPIRAKPPTEEETFEEAAKTQGTHQEISFKSQ